MRGKRVLGKGDHERQSHHGTVRAFNEVGREWGGERMSRVCVILH